MNKDIDHDLLYILFFGLYKKKYLYICHNILQTPIFFLPISFNKLQNNRYFKGNNYCNNCYVNCVGGYCINVDMQ